MTNVIPFEPKAPAQTASLAGFNDMPNATEPARKPFSFDITQTDHRGMVLLDACVPLAVATEFLRLLIAFEDGGAAVASI